MQRNGNRTTRWKVATIVLLPALALTLAAQQVTSLAVAGQQGQARVMQVQGTNYVEVNGLAVEHSYPLGADWLGSFRAQAQQALRLAGVAARTDQDKQAFQLLTNEFNNMSKLSDKYLQMTVNMNYIAPNAISNDPLDARLVACGHSLASMASARQFVDDGSCQ